jgi:hypothetical protein
VTSYKRNTVTWRGTLQPSQLSPAYQIRLRYREGHRPDVSVLQPVLQSKEGWLPHVYADSGNICLSLSYEWDASMYVAETTMPWAAEWLFFYELWLATDEWLGGDLHGEPRTLRNKGEQVLPRPTNQGDAEQQNGFEQANSTSAGPSSAA